MKDPNPLGAPEDASPRDPKCKETFLSAGLEKKTHFIIWWSSGVGATQGPGGRPRSELQPVSLLPLHLLSVSSEELRPHQLFQQRAAAVFVAEAPCLLRPCSCQPSGIAMAGVAVPEGNKASPRGKGKAGSDMMARGLGK
ncbi:hypothetical protein Q8A73_010265 [Channa argus]|nr:hypothetical protein Q8A73_010265 [Channa argus]